MYRLKICSFIVPFNEIFHIILFILALLTDDSIINILAIVLGVLFGLLFISALLTDDSIINVLAIVLGVLFGLLFIILLLLLICCCCKKKKKKDNIKAHEQRNLRVFEKKMAMDGMNNFILLIVAN
jgi:protein-S-isoprenylcysteine O-methyltransferase Ste14